MKTIEKTEKKFNSPTSGRLSFAEVIYCLVDYMEESPKEKYRLIVGTDSKTNGHNGQKVEFVTAVVIHRQGRGGRYFWRKETVANIHTLRQKIYEETNLSLATAQKLLNGLNKYLETARGNPIPNPRKAAWPPRGFTPPKYEMEIHVDIGQEGPTREMIKEIVGMVQGFGFNARTKPEAYGASKVADKHT